MITKCLAKSHIKKSFWYGELKSILIPIFGSTILFVNSTLAQNSNTIPKSAFDTLTRQSFSRIVSGSTAAPSFQNYISFNPTDGKFTANGFFYLKNRHAISFTASGGLINDNATVLFDGGKINTATDLSIKLHLRLDKPSVQVNMRDMIPIRDERFKIEMERDQKKGQLIRNLGAIQFTINDLKSQRNTLVQSGIKLQSDSSIEKTKWDLCFQINDTICLQSSGKILAKLSDDLKKWMIDITRVRKKIDSLTLIATLDQIASKPVTSLTDPEKALFVIYGLGYKSFRKRKLDEIEKEYAKKIESLYITKLPNKEISVQYLTILGNTGRLAYRTYDTSQSFNSQIQKKDFIGFSYGLEYNLLRSSDLFKRYTFFNVGLVRKKTNNLADLSTTKVVNQTSTTSGSITRNVTNEYNAYASPVEEFSLWNLYANFYKLVTDDFGSGVHFFIDFQFRDNGKSVYNAGTGYIFGITNTKDKRVLNVEPFLRFNDISGSIDDKSTSLIKRSQIGITFGLPIYFPANQKTK